MCQLNQINLLQFVEYCASVYKLKKKKNECEVAINNRKGELNVMM